MKQPHNPPQVNRRLVFQIITVFMLLVLLSLSAYRAFNRTAQPSPNSGLDLENLYAIQPIPMSGEVSKDKAEISGMAWYGDFLILLPQYPHRLGKTRNGRLFAFAKADILSFLDGKTNGPLEPVLISIDSQIYRNQIHGFEGFEAIAFYGDQAYFTIEASNPMRGYLATGTIDPDLKLLTMNPDVVEIPLPAKIDNFSDEAMIVFQDKIYTFYEAYGVNDNPLPVAQGFDLESVPSGTLPVPNIEYRITDASAPDADGNFWVINYFFFGDLIKLRPGPDRFAAGNSRVNLLSRPIERLIELKVTEDGIILGSHAPIRIALSDNGTPRNWEALARLDERGFLIATDKFPETILAFIGH